MKNVIEKTYTPWLIVPVIVVFGLFFVLPNIFALLLGFTDWNAYSFNKFNYNGFDNFKKVFGSGIFLKALFNTVFFTIVSILFKNIFGIAFAVILNKKLKLKNFYRTIIYAPCIMSMMVVAITFKAIYSIDGLLNIILRFLRLGFLERDWIGDQKLAMISVCGLDIWMFTGVTMIICLAGIQTIPKELYEAATIDGAKESKQLWYITIPLIFQSITFVTILGLIGGLKVFGQVFALTNGGPNDSTQVISFLQYTVFGNGLYGYAAAIGLVFTLFICIVSFLLLGIMRKLEVEY